MSASGRSEENRSKSSRGSERSRRHRGHSPRPESNPSHRREYSGSYHSSQASSYGSGSGSSAFEVPVIDVSAPRQASGHNEPPPIGGPMALDPKILVWFDKQSADPVPVEMALIGLVVMFDNAQDGRDLGVPEYLLKIPSKDHDELLFIADHAKFDDLKEVLEAYNLVQLVQDDDDNRTWLLRRSSLATGIMADMIVQMMFSHDILFKVLEEAINRILALVWQAGGDAQVGNCIQRLKDLYKAVDEKFSVPDRVRGRMDELLSNKQ